MGFQKRESPLPSLSPPLPRTKETQGEGTRKRGERRRKKTHIGDALEEDGLVARPGRVPKGADGPGPLVVGVGGEEVVEALVAQVLEEPFTICCPPPHVCFLLVSYLGHL